MIEKKRLQLAVTIKKHQGPIWSFSGENCKQTAEELKLPAEKNHDFCIDQWESCQKSFLNTFVKWHS